jgi:hypothetical protein
MPIKTAHRRGPPIDDQPITPATQSSKFTTAHVRDVGREEDANQRRPNANPTLRSLRSVAANGRTGHIAPLAPLVGMNRLFKLATPKVRFAQSNGKALSPRKVAQHEWPFMVLNGKVHKSLNSSSFSLPFGDGDDRPTTFAFPATGGDGRSP